MMNGIMYVLSTGCQWRAVPFPDALLRSNTSAKYPGALEWPSIGLPDDYLALIAQPLRAFIGEGKRTVAHGGICIEEAIVPFVTVARSE